jgi:hypothetical protein
MPQVGLKQLNMSHNYYFHTIVPFFKLRCCGQIQTPPEKKKTRFLALRVPIHGLSLIRRR